MLLDKCLTLEKQTIRISDIEKLLEEYDVYVSSPDGMVRVESYNEKGLFDEYILETPNSVVRVNINHKFKTQQFGWLTVREIIKLQTGIDLLYNENDQWVTGTIKSTGEIIPIVDITVDHENQRYYTNGIESHNSGQGKSIALVNVAAAALQRGENVLYITLEMAERKIAERVDAKLMNIEVSDVRNIGLDKYMSLVSELQSKSQGELIIKQFPTSAASVLDFRHILEELSLKRNWKPDLLIVDYLGICADTRKGDNTYIQQKHVAEDLRGMGIEYGFPVFTAAQINRSGYGNSSIGMENISDSIAVVMTADCVISIFQNEELEESNSAIMKFLKNRYGPVDTVCMVGLNKAKMSFYDIDDHSTADRLVSKYQDDLPPSEDTHKFNKGFKSNRSFDDLLLED